jgi:hypothetical protein
MMSPDGVTYGRSLLIVPAKIDPVKVDPNLEVLVEIAAS